MKLEIHWAQNTVANRFQEYVDNDAYVTGETEGPLIDLTNIKKVQVGMWGGDMDTTCSFDQARITKQEIGDNVTHFEEIAGADHGWFGGANSDEFMQSLDNFFRNGTDKSQPRVMNFLTE